MRKRFSSLNLFIYLFIIAIGVGILLYVFNGFLFTRSIETFYAELQRIEIASYASGYIAKEEKIYYSPAAGKTKRIIEPGELVKNGAEVIQVIQDDGKVVSVKAEKGGLITYIMDNCEERYNVGNIDKLLVSEILNPPVKQERVGGGESVKKGDFLFKIVGNDKINYILIFDKDEKEKINEGKSLVFAVEYPVNMLVEGKIEKVEDREDNKCLAIFSTDYYVETLLNWRKISGRFVFGTYTASFVPKKALSKNEKNEDIVYVKSSSGIPEAFKVTILGKDYSGDNFIVQGLNKFVEVYYDANFAKEKIKQANE